MSAAPGRWERFRADSWSGRLRWLARPRLLTRVAFFLALVGLLPLAIAYFGLVHVNTDALYDQVQRTHIVVAETAASRVAAFLGLRRALAAGAAGNPALDDPRSPAAQELLGQDLASWSGLGVLAIAVVDDQGREAVRAQLKDPEARAKVALALAAVPKTAPNTPISPTAPIVALAGLSAVVGGRPGLLLRFSVALESGGVVLLVCDGTPLTELINPLALGESADLLLARRDGRVLVGSVPSLQAFPPQMVPTALGGQVEGAGRFPGRRGAEVIGAYAPVPGVDWVVLSQQPSRVAEAVAWRMRRQTAIAGGAALLLVLLVSALAWSSLVRPLREVVQAQRRLAGGVGGANPAKTGNEIEDLKLAFDALSRNLLDRRALDNVFLGRYQVVEYLGMGAMGTVFRGWDPKLQRPVALKTVRLGELAPEARRDLLSTLLHEAVTVARVNHGNVVSIYDVEDAPEGAFIAMEYVQGVSLERLLWRRGRLDASEVIPLGVGIARGLAVAHERGIMHRDVKPANILLGMDASIKVTDFGIADLFTGGGSSPADSIFGTPGYVPPESLEGRGTSRSGDLFALGVVLYQCLSGIAPFAGRNVAEILKATLFGDYRPLRRLVPEVPAGLESLIGHLLERDPARRPADAGAVAAELERMALEGHLRWRLEITPAEEGESPLTALEEERRIAAQWIPTSRLLVTHPRAAMSAGPP